MLLKFAEAYAKAYAEGEELYGEDTETLFDEFSLYLIPMVNPDGADLVNGIIRNEEYLEQTRAISEDYPSIPYPSGWKANINGIDLNLQFPAGWENAREIKFAQGYTSPAPRDFVGDAPLSAVESINMYHFTIAHDFQLILAYHTQEKSYTGNILTMSRNIRDALPHISERSAVIRWKKPHMRPVMQDTRTGLSKHITVPGIQSRRGAVKIRLAWISFRRFTRITG